MKTGMTKPSAGIWWRRIPRPLRWLGALFVALLLILVGAGLTDWNFARGFIGRMASRQLERRVSIGGPLRVHLLSSAPSLAVDGLSIANPDWAGGGDMLQVPHLLIELQLSQLLRGHLVLRTVELDAPQLSLLRDARQRANWDVGKPAAMKSQ